MKVEIKNMLTFLSEAPVNSKCFAVAHRQVRRLSGWSGWAQILNNNNGDPVRKGHLRKRSPTASNFIAVQFQLVQFVKCWQFLLKFTLKDCFEIQGKEKVICCVHALHTENMKLGIFTS